MIPIYFTRAGLITHTNTLLNDKGISESEKALIAKYHTGFLVSSNGQIAFDLCSLHDMAVLLVIKIKITDAERVRAINEWLKSLN